METLAQLKQRACELVGCKPALKQPKVDDAEEEEVADSEDPGRFQRFRV